jgi:crotonobetainyl-CoA:carnitine CoA-transferase CaiB-like acyl-CoA transferase
VTQQKKDSLLGGYRVLDVTDEKGLLCTKVLADLGADVIKIERPGGDPVRNIGPFYHDIPDPEKSLYWFTFNTGKRSITLDIEKCDGQEIFKRLVRIADFAIECFPSGYMDKLGLGYSLLSEINPRIIVTSITAFGQAGPYKDYKASDIVGMAMGGLMSICGDADRPPVRHAASQAYAQAGVQAALGTLIAHYHRELTGEGQQVDVSMQECVCNTLQQDRQWWFHGHLMATRSGSSLRLIAGMEMPIIFPCKDGFVACQALVYPSPAGLRQWMADEGMAGDLVEEKYEPWFTGGIAAVAMRSGGDTEEMMKEHDHINDLIKAFFMTHTKAELYEGSLPRRIILNPVNTVKDLRESPQLKARDYFVQVEHPELGDTLTYPGAPYKLSETPWRIWRRPPLIGEHNEEIYEKELGLSKEEFILFKQAKVI